MENNAGHPASPTPLSEMQARIVGVLLEKSATTPDAYPLTLNAAVVACNQKTSRDPLTNFEPGAVGHALRELEDLGLVRVVHGARALRYEHRFDEYYTVTARQRALLCLLLLRGAQTQGELHTRSDRLATFATPDDVHDTLERLTGREPALAMRLTRGPGQREDRYIHLLCGTDAALRAADRATTNESTSSMSAESIEARICALEERVAVLEARRDS